MVSTHNQRAAYVSEDQLCSPSLSEHTSTWIIIRGYVYVQATLKVCLDFCTKVSLDC